VGRTGRAELAAHEQSGSALEHSHPIRFEAERYQGTTGRRVCWFGDSSGWRRMSGIPVPGKITAWWSDEPGPWFELRVEEARPNVNIGEALDKGRRAIADARRKKEPATR
jgi:hypothetical protein